jgi:hypothetical protein
MGVATPSALNAIAQGQDQDCPSITINCPDADPSENSPIRFKVTVTGGKPIHELSYCWSVSKGTIKKGQGTVEIEIEAKGVDRESLTASVDIGGFDPKCGHTVSCSTTVH